MKCVLSFVGEEGQKTFDWPLFQLENLMVFVRKYEDAPVPVDVVVANKLREAPDPVGKGKDKKAKASKRAHGRSRMTKAKVLEVIEHLRTLRDHGGSLQVQSLLNPRYLSR